MPKSVDPATSASQNPPEPASEPINLASANVIRSLRNLTIASLLLAGVAAILSASAVMIARGNLHFGTEADFNQKAQAYLLANPDIIAQSVAAAQANKQAVQADNAAAALERQREEIFNDPATPVGINAKGDVGLVEFFDYNCPYCRKAEPIIDALEAADHGVRLIYKEFPILGPGSIFAAKAALASQKQGKYLAFHKAMMTYVGSITETSVLEIAATVGLDVEQLKKDMTGSALDEQLARNFDLASTLDINGTPGFIAGKQVVHGLADAAAMQQLIAAARQK